MSSVRPMNRYPEELLQLFARAFAEGSTSIACTTREQAEAFRSRLYALRTALIDEPEFNPRLTLLAPLLSFRITEQDNYFHLSIERQPLPEHTTNERAL